MTEVVAAPAHRLPAPNSAGAWILAARPKTLVAGWAPVLVGTSIAALYGFVIPVRAAAALVVAMLIQVGTNLVNDAGDHARGADTAERLGPPRAVASGLLHGRTVMTIGVGCFAVAGLVGLWLASVAGWWLLLPGGIALLAGIGYTAGPKPLAYIGLGEVFVFVFFGLFATAGTAYVQLVDGPSAAASMPMALWAGVSLGLLSVAILEVNNLRDIPTDVHAGKRTLATRMGEGTTRSVVIALLVAACLAPLAFRASPFIAWVVVLAAAPFAVQPIRAVARKAAGVQLNPVLGLVARLEMAMAAGLVARSLLSTVGQGMN